MYYADVTFDAWSGLTIADLQVPSLNSSLIIQRNVSNMVVKSNYPGVENGFGFTGRLEIWSSDYASTTMGNIGGSNELYDFNDTPVFGKYGSFQIHNISSTTPQTILAWNNPSLLAWSNQPVAVPDVGFGNRPISHPDWTFSGSDGLGTSNWKLQISVENTNPGFTITPITAATTSETGITAKYNISLNTAPLVNQNVTISFISSNTSEAVINTPTLIFDSTNYATPKTLIIQGVNDYLDDSDVPYQVTLCT